MFGVNRITRRAIKLRGVRSAGKFGGRAFGGMLAGGLTGAPFRAYEASLVERFHQAPWAGGNRVHPLRSGDLAFLDMLRAIGEAKASIAFATYIFNDDSIGRRFVDALADAQARGVEVRVLIDGVGALYSVPPIAWRLRRRSVRAERFLTSILPWRMTYLNLRNHRKILVVDGRIGFLGGMNIKRAHVLAENTSRPTNDMQFRVEGQAVADLMAVFAADWAFTSGETLSGDLWFPALEAAGGTDLRCLASGPDEEVGSLRRTLLGVLTQVRTRLRISTPYFLPDDEITNLLSVAALRGVEVDIVLPEKSNQFYMKWAETATFPRLFAAGCRIWLEAPPFDHMKLAVADDQWPLFGSSNWDARSLRLNFEIDTECIDADLARELDTLITAKIARSRAVTLEDLAARGVARRLRDGIARLFKPFL